MTGRRRVGPPISRKVGRRGIENGRVGPVGVWVTTREGAVVVGGIGADPVRVARNGVLFDGQRPTSPATAIRTRPIVMIVPAIYRQAPVKEATLVDHDAQDNGVLLERLQILVRNMTTKAMTTKMN